MKQIEYKIIVLLAIFSLTSISCKKLIEIELPIDKSTSESVYSNTNTAVRAMTGIYISLVSNQPSNYYVTEYNGISINLGLMGDELDANFLLLSKAYINDLNPDDFNFWTGSYREIIYGCNSVINGVSASPTLSDQTKDLLIGEAKFTRALTYFYLVNLYGDVPLVLGTDFKINSNIERAKEQIVYSQIISDLIDAQQKLKNEYLGPDLKSTTTSRLRPNKLAATALLARVYLYLKDWKNAEVEASKVIDQKGLYSLEDLSETFTSTSREAIWQLQPNPNDPRGANCPDARIFIPDAGVDPDFSISQELLGKFTPDDKRKDAWTKEIDATRKYVIPFKYKQGKNAFIQKEYVMVLRLAEQYLVRAEARARIGNLDGSIEDLNIIRRRAGLNETMYSSQEVLLESILEERRIELFSEWGHRWLDLKRLGKLDYVMPEVVKRKINVDGVQASWSAYKSLIPIPYDELLYNKSLRGHQNPGYPETR